MNLFKTIIFLFALALLIACATVVAPSGGPEDKLPPRVSAIYPSPNATNLPTELLVRIEFDEWIQSTLPRNAVTISPPLEKKLRFEVSGDVLEITSKGDLDSNTTYTLTLGNALKDLRGNSISPPFQLSFSTGKHIDSLFLIGRILLMPEMLKNKHLPSVALYPLGSQERNRRNYLQKYKDSTQTEVDSVPVLTKEIPLFFTQTDSTGYFKAVGLSPGKYRVLAFVDANGNRKLEPSDELAGIYGDILLDSLFKDSLWLPLANIDDSPVTLDSVKALGNTMVRPVFNRPVVSESLLGCRLFTATKNLLDSLTLVLGTSSEPVFALSKTLEEDSTYLFSCEKGNDSLGRSLDSLRNEVEFVWKAFPADTFPPAISAISPKQGTKFVFPEDSIHLTFDKVVIGDSLAQELIAVVRKDTLSVIVTRLDAANFFVKTESPLPYDAKVSLMQRYLDSTLALPDSLGVRDTIVEEKYRSLTSFEMVPKLRLASLQGKILNANSKVKVRLRSAETGKEYESICSAEGSFEFKKLIDGKYLLDYFQSNESGYIDAGNIKPLRFAKPWRSLADTLILQPGNNELKDLPALLQIN